MTTKQQILDAIDDLKSLVESFECEEPPSGAVLPTAVNCLNGTNPGSISMITAELNESAWINARSAHTTALASVPNGTIMFLGDSQIELMDVEDISPFSFNAGIAGESSRQLIYRLLNDTILRTKCQNAGALVIETFVNDLGDSSTYSSSASANDTIIPFMLAKISNWVSGKTVIICPTKVGDKSPAFWTSNTAIETLNDEIKNIFSNRTDVVVIDINPTIAPNGWLLPEYSTDYHHLNTTAARTVENNAVRAALTTLGLEDSLTQ